MQKVVTKQLGPFWSGVVWLCWAMMAISGLGLATMIIVSCGDVVLRTTGHPVKGAYDIVRVSGAVTIACAVPITTAMKGHVAIEFFSTNCHRVGASRWIRRCAS